MPRKKKDEPQAVEPQPVTSRFAEVFAQVKANEEHTDTVDEAPNPIADRAEDVAEKLSGTPVGREMLANVLTGALDTLTDAIAPLLTKLEQYSEDIDTVTGSDGVEYRLITLSDLTGWRRREAWKVLAGLKTSFGIWQREYDLFTAAGEVAASEKGVYLLGLAYGPVGAPYDKSKVDEYAAAVDDALTTKQITGMVIRFFSLSASFIQTFSRNCLEALAGQLLGALATTSPTPNETSADG